MWRNAQGRARPVPAGSVEGRDIDRKELPRLVNDTFLKNTELDIPEKQSITIRLDVDVLDWFKRQGRGYQTHINKLLRSYMEANRDR
jgi:uncharacterized protein (DUF4415 family)